MEDIEFDEYIESSWSFLAHEEGVWGGTPGTPTYKIENMDKKHLENSIEMIKRCNVHLPQDEFNKERLNELKENKLNELERALKSKERSLL